MTRFEPDRTAQRLWREVAHASNTIAGLVDLIPFGTSRGEESRSELWQARALLKQAVVLLERTESRESARYSESDGEAGWAGSTLE
jgi:hypothetical protein